MISLKLLIPICTGVIILTGCGGVSQLDQAALETKRSNNMNVKKEISEEEQLAEWKNFYKDYEKPVEDALKVDPDIEVEKNKNNFEVKDRYENENEFALFLTNELVALRKGKLEADEYLSFLKQFSSDYYKSKYGIGENEIKNLNFVENVISYIGKNNVDIQSYQISTVLHNDGIDYEGYFYIEFIYNTGQKAHYRIEIEKDTNEWKFKDERMVHGIVFKENGNVLEKGNE